MAADGSIISLQSVGVQFDSDGDWIDASLEANDNVLLQGDNGCGKSTLVQLILGEIGAKEGSVHRTTQNVLYFPQTALHRLLRQHGTQSAIEFLSDTTSDMARCNTASVSSMTETQTQHHLGDFGLDKDLALRRVNTLSVGQRVRLRLTRELLRHPKPALLILDEMSEKR